MMNTKRGLVVTECFSNYGVVIVWFFILLVKLVRQGVIGRHNTADAAEHPRRVAVSRFYVNRRAMSSDDVYVRHG